MLILRHKLTLCYSDESNSLHFSNVELSDTRTARPYICIVQNSVLGKLVQGDDQIVVPRHGSGIVEQVVLGILAAGYLKVCCSIHMQ